MRTHSFNTIRVGVYFLSHFRQCNMTKALYDTVNEVERNINGVEGNEGTNATGRSRAAIATE